MNACDLPIQVRRRPQVFLCIEDVRKFMLFLAFPFAVKLIYKRKVSCASKADTVDNPGAVICIARFIWHVQFAALLLFGNNISDKQRVCQKIVTSERKANDHDYNQCMQSNDNLKLIHGFDIEFRTSTLKIDRQYNRGTQREYSSKPLKHSIVKRILVLKR